MQQTPANLQILVAKIIQLYFNSRKKSLRDRTSVPAQGLSLKTSHWKDKKVKERAKSIM